MSRGGRSRGRGGRPNIPGLDYDPNQKLDTKPSELFPVCRYSSKGTKGPTWLLHNHADREKPYQVPVAATPSEKEKREVAFYLGLRERFHKSPLYTAPQARDAIPTKFYGEDQYNNQFHNRMKPDIDPFEGMPRYSWRYDQEKRAIPQLSARPFDKSLFPEELWTTLEGEEGKAIRKTINRGLEKKAEFLAGSIEYKGATSRGRNLKQPEKINPEADDPDTEVDREEDEEEVQEEEKDYDYEEDEAEMGGDYLAEQYFDGGEGDEDDGMDTGAGDDY